MFREHDSAGFVLLSPICDQNRQEVLEGDSGRAGNTTWPASRNLLPITSFHAFLELKPFYFFLLYQFAALQHRGPGGTD
jgi:hypothetical protein